MSLGLATRGLFGTTIIIAGGGGVVDPPDPPTPIISAVTHGDPNYLDVVSHALDRLAQQFKEDP